MKLSELCFYAGIEFDGNDTEISGVTSDSRRVMPGNLFVCLQGTHNNGAEYSKKAVLSGACAVLYGTEDMMCGQLGVCELVTHDTRAALSRLCRKMYGDDIDKLKLVAVTGTNGKTSIVNILKSICISSGHRCGTVGTLGCTLDSGERIKIRASEENTDMTTPDPEYLYGMLSEMAKMGAELVFVENSSHALALKKTDALGFEAGIYTNLTRDHYDFHLTAENYAAAKARVFGLCKQVIYNADDVKVREAAKQSTCRTLSCSQRGKADFSAVNVEMYGADGCAYRLVSEYGSFPVRSRLNGGFTVMNTLEAAACALTLGISPDCIATGIFGVGNVPGRMEKVGVREKTGFEVYIDYAHTPDALENALRTARDLALPDGRVIVVFGCGGDRDRGKRPQMARVASRLADFSVITSDNSRSENPDVIIADILRGMDKEKRYCTVKDRREAIEFAVNLAERGDIVLLAGKGHEKYEINKNGRYPFDEAEIVGKVTEGL